MARTCWTGVPRKKVEPVNIQAGTGSGPDTQISLNVIESASNRSLRIANSDISTEEGPLHIADRFEQASQTLNAARGQWKR